MSHQQYSPVPPPADHQDVPLSLAGEHRKQIASLTERVDHLVVRSGQQVTELHKEIAVLKQRAKNLEWIVSSTLLAVLLVPLLVVSLA